MSKWGQYIHYSQQVKYPAKGLNALKVIVKESFNNIQFLSETDDDNYSNKLPWRLCWRRFWLEKWKGKTCQRQQ